MSTAFQSISRYQIPRYIRPLPLGISAVALDFLARSGALTLPDANLSTELLRVFVQYVHPFLPLLDLEGILPSVVGEDESIQVSLLLFQSVMFAAASYVDLHYLEVAGFASRKEARRAFFHKVKVSTTISVYGRRTRA